MRELPQILQLDVGGVPQRWITYEKSAYYYGKDRVAWSMGEVEFDLHGGISAKTGEQSIMTINTIIAVRNVNGKPNKRQYEQNNRVPLTNLTLFRRDQNLCAYCGKTFSKDNLSRDHIHPTSRGGPNTWMNVVTSCHSCNKYKDNKTLQEAGMELLYAPYVPNRAEYLILRNRKILADQMDFLLKQVPKESRLL